ILVAEDEAINRKLMQVFLQRLDFTCDFAVNGRETLTKMRLKRYDIVFLDIQMPEMSGLEVLEVVRRDRDLAGTVVVALTANAIKGDSEKYIVAGCDDYLAKPVSLEMLGEKIAYWRQRAGRRGEWKSHERQDNRTPPRE
ncbi:MAG TPA: response regulator, partial [Candidatus Aminicenantes bacterium]|nr:response regulator [Candidatus Aminicenantes bacterium]